MKHLHLSTVRFKRICRANGDCVADNRVTVVLPNNSSPEMAVEKVIEVLKEEGTWYRGWDYEFELPHDDESSAVHIPSSVEKQINDCPLHWAILPTGGWKTAQQKAVEDFAERKANGEHAWWDQGPEPKVTIVKNHVNPGT